MNYFSKSLYKSNGYLRQSISSTINYLSITSTTINQVRYNSNSSRSKDRHRDNSSRKNTTNSNKKRLDQSTSKQNDSYKLFKGIKVLPENDIFKENIGEELAGKLEKSALNRMFLYLRDNPTMLALSSEKGLTPKMFMEAVLSFREYCMHSKPLPVELHLKLYDIINNAGNESDIFPYFLQHAYKTYPHLNCIEELKFLSDLSEPANWYPAARDIKRRIIYHSGPTNSGKTYSALKAFINSSSGIYCGPLKLLANECHSKTNENGTSCDLVTGEERKFANTDNTPANHISCTVEMVNLEKDYEVAVIDEIQMISDQQRGWAWTRAFLGLKAKEIHLCGDQTALDLISELSFLTGDSLEVKKYDRLTKLNFSTNSVDRFENVEAGDCIVCFNKTDIYSVSKALENLGHDVAVIYGAMPPTVKTAQANRFNDPNDKCKILVATDAVGMGLNLNIRRIIFYSLKKPQMSIKSDNDQQSQQPETPSTLTLSLTNNYKYQNNEQKKLSLISTSQALQIAGRAGRFKTMYEDGHVTTFNKSDLPVLMDILKMPLELSKKAGLHPTAEQIEMFSYQLPEHSLSTLIQIFMSICTIDNKGYFLCNFEEIRLLATMIDHIKIPIKNKFTFVTSPISTRNTFVTSCFVKFVRYYSRNEELTGDILKRLLGYPFKSPLNLNELAHLEDLYDVLDLYLWLSFRFNSIFCQREEVFEIRKELEEIIFNGVKELLSNKNYIKSSRQLKNKTSNNDSIKRNVLSEKINQISSKLSNNLESESENFKLETHQGDLFLKEADNFISEDNQLESRKRIKSLFETGVIQKTLEELNQKLDPKNEK